MLAKGYDILVWMDTDGDVVCTSYTKRGNVFLKSIGGKYRAGSIMEIMGEPKEFQELIPPDVRVGLLSPETNKVARMAKNSLH